MNCFNVLYALSRSYRIVDHFSNQINKTIIIIFLSPYILLFGLLSFCVGKCRMLLWKRNDYKYTLGIVVIAKNEAECIEEWIAFHQAVGVEHIYLFDNESTDNMRELLIPYIDKGFLTYQPLKGKMIQLKAYNLALRLFGRECKYLAFIDCDEFLFPCNNKESLVDVITKAFSKSQNVGGIAVNWAMYGSSGHIEKPEGFVIENYVWRAKMPYGRGTECVKSIVRSDAVSKYVHPHFPRFKVGFYNVSCNGNIVNGWRNSITSYQGLRINHYFTKSKAHWQDRISKGQVFALQPRTWEEFYEHDNNDVKDNSALYYSDNMKRILKINSSYNG